MLRLGLRAWLVLALAGCGSSSSPELSLTASSTAAMAGGPAIRLTATGEGAAAAVWSLAGPGGLVPTTGSAVAYLPPDASALTEDAIAIASAQSGSSRATVDIAVKGSGSMDWEHTRIVGANLTKAAFGAGRFVLLEGGVVGGSAYAGDGRNWTRVTPLAPGLNATAIAYGNGRFVVVGWKSASTAVVIASADGINWTDVTPVRASGPANSGAIHELRAVAFAGGSFTAVGRYGTTITSTDGLAWIDVTVPGAGEGPVYDPAWPGSNDLVSLGGDGKQLWAGGMMIPPFTHGLGLPGPPWALNVFSAADAGRTWTHVPRAVASPCYPSGPMATDGSRIVAGGYCNESALVGSVSGANWNPPASVGSRARPLLSCAATITGSLNPNIASIAFGGGRFVAVACGQVVSSINGADWGYAGGAIWNGATAVTMKDVSYAGDRFIAVGGPDLLVSK